MRTSIAVIAMLGFASCADSSEEPRDIGSGKFRDGGDARVQWTGAAGLNVREAPTRTSARVGWLAEGTDVTVECQTEGDLVGASNVWDYLAGEGYVADAYIDSGYASWIPGVPKCGAVDEGCGDVDYAGYCDGATLVWCEDDALRSVDCGQTGQSCGWRDDAIGNDCLTSGGGDGDGGGDGGGGGGRLTISEIVGGAYFDVSQAFGPTSFDGGYSYCQSYGNWGGALVHCGIDIAIPNGTPLYVPENGTVTIVGSAYFEDWNVPGAENSGELRIQTADGTDIILGHMSRIDLWEGQAVEASDWAGLSGYANGDHVHIEVRVPDNGTAAGQRAVDPAQYFGL